MQLKLYQVDAFANEVFKGNPAAIVPLDRWLDDRTMQNIATENNLSETAFFIEEDGGFNIRWFTPLCEVDLCGHATLASAHVIFRHLAYGKKEIAFRSKTGMLRVFMNEGRYYLDFPSWAARPAHLNEDLADIFGKQPLEVYHYRDLLLVFDSEDFIRKMKPDVDQMNRLKYLGCIVTAPAKDYDYITRFFAPNAGILEDPATGSAQCTLIPYWSARLGKKKMVAFQASKRSGILYCEHHDQRVYIGGYAIDYLEGTIHIPGPA
jgi:PhzF family phenazine biosynthesis protein